jgi:hypothetical protein
MKFLALAILAAITSVLLATPSHGQKGSAPADGIDPLLDQFWKTWDEQSPQAAISGALRGREDRAKVYADTLATAMTQMGKCDGRDEISRAVIGSRLVRVRYLLRFESQPLFFDMIYYRPDTRWRIESTNFTTDDAKIVAEMAGNNESRPNVADAR